MISRTISFAVVLALLSAASASAAAAPPLMPIVGYLTAGAGGPVDGSVTMRYNLYGDEAALTPFFTEVHTVDVDEGAFSVYLGDLDPLDLAVVASQSAIWVGVQVVGELEMVPRIEVGSVAFAAFAQYAGSIAWDDITGVPTGLADGDDDTEYSAALPIALTSGTFELSAATCASGDTWIWGGVGVGWQCAPVTAYLIGDGLALDPLDNTLSVATNIQRRVTQACGTTQAIRQINANGTVICMDDDGGFSSFTVNGTVAAPHTGGLVATVTSEAVDVTVDYGAVQARVANSCPTNWFARSISADGTLVCGPTPPGAVYVVATPGPGELGAGLIRSVNGANDYELEVDYDDVQARLTGNCNVGAGQYLYGVDAVGAPLCSAPTFTDTNTTYAADGTTISMSGPSNTFAVNLANVQHRLHAGGPSTCPNGIASVAATGVVTCAATPVDNNTTYSTGWGLANSGTQFYVNNAAVQQRVHATGLTECPYGIRRVYQDGHVDCATNNDTNTWPSGLGNNCGWGLYMYGTDAAGNPRCRRFSEYQQSSCYMFFAWADSNRWLDRLMHIRPDGTGYGAWHSQHSRSNFDELSVHWANFRTGGNVNDDDWFYVQQRCD